VGGAKGWGKGWDMGWGGGVLNALAPDGILNLSLTVIRKHRARGNRIKG
jgi:hypothetical protein